MELAAPDLPFLSQSAEILGSAVTRPHIPLYPRVSQQLQTMLEAALTGRLDPDAAARLAAGLIEAITGLPIVREPAGVTGGDRDGAHYLAAAATADRVAETTTSTDAIPAAAQTTPPATNIAGIPTTT